MNVTVTIGEDGDEAPQSLLRQIFEIFTFHRFTMPVRLKMALKLINASKMSHLPPRHYWLVFVCLTAVISSIVVLMEPDE